MTPRAGGFGVRSSSSRVEALLRAKRNLVSALIAVSLAVILTTGFAPQEKLAFRADGCALGQFCYFYSRDQKGALAAFFDSVSDYGETKPNCYQFWGTGAGRGACVRNNAASVWNRSFSTVRVFSEPGYKGNYQDIPVGAQYNLKTNLRNNEASHIFIDTLEKRLPDRPSPGRSNANLLWLEINAPN